MKNLYIKTIVIFISIPILFLSFCDFATKPAHENQPPTTTIANIPVEMDTLFPRVQIICDGGDEDGYILGYEYRVKTIHLKMKDSTITNWKYISEDSSNGILDIIFESSDTLNQQIIQVRSMDDDSAVDPTPAEKYLFTPRTYYPVTTINSPVNNSQFYYLDEMTDWWQGIKLNFSASDKDGEIVEYGWSLDDNDFIWTTDTVVNLTSDIFIDGVSGKHTIKVISKDNTNLIDTIGAEIKFTFIKPEFNKNILIIDDTEERHFPSSASRSDAVVDSIYNKLFSPDSSIDYKENGMPSKTILGNYKLVIWHSDNPSSIHHLVAQEEKIQDYLNVGGNLIVSGWQVLKQFAFDQNFPMEYEEGSFVRDYLHVTAAQAHGGLFGDFTQASGYRGTPTLVLDGALMKGFPYNEKLKLIEVMIPGPFTEVLSTYLGEDKELSKYPVGISYLGTQYNVITLTFPLCLMKDDNLQDYADMLLEKINIF